QPALARLRRSDHGVFGHGRVFARVTIRRTVAAQSRAALLANAKMEPLRADLQTLGAFANFRLLHRSDLVEMRTAAIAHENLPLFLVANLSWIPATAIPPSPTAA